MIMVFSDCGRTTAVVEINDVSCLEYIFNSPM